MDKKRRRLCITYVIIAQFNKGDLIINNLNMMDNGQKNKHYELERIIMYIKIGR
jgi:hypothetical protein